MLSRRRFALTAPAALAAGSGLAACTGEAGAYAAAVARTWRSGPLQGLQGAALTAELVRYATLAPNSHNAQCWQFVAGPGSISLRPDFSRRLPVVDPDDHHVWVSLGCATENLVQAAGALGLHAEPRFDAARAEVVVALSPGPARSTPWFQAIVQRQCTRADYDGRPLAAQELQSLALAATPPGDDSVRLVLLTDAPRLGQLQALAVQANTTQVQDRAFVAELKTWLRFNGADAARHGDGLFSAASGNPELPAWLGGLMFGLVFSARSENDKLLRQLRSSAGVAVFVGARPDPAHWVAVGRACERFALQATVLGLRHAHVNQPVEVPAARAPLASLVGLPGQRPDLVLRFGRGPLMPRSLRRPVAEVLRPA